MAKKNGNENKESFEQKLWKTADKLRKNIDAAEYKHVVLGLIFLKYISDAFEELYYKLKAGEGDYAGADPEDKDEYGAENVFFVPEKARWSYIQSQAKLPNIGKLIDDAMDLIEADNATLKGILPKTFGRSNLDPQTLGGLIDTIGTVALGDEKAKSQDVLGRVYEYFLGQFALAEGQKGGQFYTPESIVKLLVEMLEPYKGRVYDPCCGSGGMFVQSEKFIESHQGRLDDISIYGQESNQTTYRLCRMNLAIRGIDGSNIKWNTEGSFLNNAHKDLKADYIIANPPFNVSDWSGELLRDDARWQYGVPPTGNANFGWVQHFLYHLKPDGGHAGFVLANGSLSSNTGGEGAIRQKLIENDLVECIVMLPKALFFNTGIPACLWFLRRGKKHRHGQTLFIDASELGYMINRKNRVFAPEDISKVADTYHAWLNAPQPPKGGDRTPSVLNSSNPALYGELKTRAEKMRANPTEAEGVLWERIRNKLLGVKFRQQHIVDQYIVDFCSIQHGLVIEVDGEIHKNQKEEDEIRTQVLETKGYKVIRFSNEQVLNKIENVIEEIKYAIEERGSKSPLGGLGAYEDIKGFCKSATLEDIQKHKYVLTPGRYVGIPDEEDDGIPFQEKVDTLTSQLREQMEQAQVLDKEIKEQLAKVGIKL
jgi:type I restriction enzyme M protein